MDSPDMAVSLVINGSVDLAECVSVCVLHVRDFRCCGMGARVGADVLRYSELGVRGELKQRDGLHLSARPTLKWPSLRID